MRSNLLPFRIEVVLILCLGIKQVFRELLWLFNKIICFVRDSAFKYCYLVVLMSIPVSPPQYFTRAVLINPSGWKESLEYTDIMRFQQKTDIYLDFSFYSRVSCDLRSVLWFRQPRFDVGQHCFYCPAKEWQLKGFSINTANCLPPVLIVLISQVHNNFQINEPYIVFVKTCYFDATVGRDKHVFMEILSSTFASMWLWSINLIVTLTLYAFCGIVEQSNNPCFWNDGEVGKLWKSPTYFNRSATNNTDFHFTNYVTCIGFHVTAISCLQ